MTETPLPVKGRSSLYGRSFQFVGCAMDKSKHSPTGWVNICIYEGRSQEYLIALSTPDVVHAHTADSVQVARLGVTVKGEQIAPYVHRGVEIPFAELRKVMEESYPAATWHWRTENANK